MSDPSATVICMSNTVVSNTSLHPAGPGNWSFTDLTRCADCGLTLGLHGHLTINCGERDFEPSACDVCGSADPHPVHPEQYENLPEPRYGDNRDG